MADNKSLKPLVVTTNKRNITTEEAESKARKERTEKRKKMLNKVVKAAVEAVRVTTPKPLVGKVIKTISGAAKVVVDTLKSRDEYRKKSIEKMIKEEKLKRAMEMHDFDYIEKNYK